MASKAVQDGEENEGLYQKYEVYKGGEAVPNSFVLEPESDPAAREAIAVYARSTDDPELAADLQEWVGKLEGQESDGEVGAEIYHKTIPVTFAFIVAGGGLWWADWFSTGEMGAFVAAIALMHASVGMVEGYL